MSKLAQPDQYDKLSLQKLLLGFIKFAHDSGKTSFPPFESHFWHEFLFLLKSDFSARFPELDCIGNFDWDGIHPKCKEYNVAMFAIRSYCYSNPNHLTTPSLAAHDHKLAKKVLEIAESIPGFFEE